jgi:hypothetical protein
MVWQRQRLAYLKLQLWWMRSSTISRPLESNQMKCAFPRSLWRCPLPVSWGTPHTDAALFRELREVGAMRPRFVEIKTITLKDAEG